MNNNKTQEYTARYNSVVTNFESIRDEENNKLSFIKIQLDKEIKQLFDELTDNLQKVVLETDQCVDVASESIIEKIKELATMTARINEKRRAMLRNM